MEAGLLNIGSLPDWIDWKDVCAAVTGSVHFKQLESAVKCALCSPQIS